MQSDRSHVDGCKMIAVPQIVSDHQPAKSMKRVSKGRERVHASTRGTTRNLKASMEIITCQLNRFSFPTNSSGLVKEEPHVLGGAKDSEPASGSHCFSKKNLSSTNS